jgi:hypothetical protein
MGRYLKNTELRSGSYSIRAPYGYSAIGHTSPVTGLFRLNGDTGKLEYYSGTAWRILAIEGASTIVKDTYTGDGSATQFGPMSVAYTAGQETQLLVFIGNVFQNPAVAFTVAGTNINFTSPPNNLQPVVVLHGYASTVVGL